MEIRWNTDAERKDMFLNLIEPINLRQEEDYDCSQLNVWSYRKGTDFRDGVNIKFGNMCNGFPFKVAGVPFFNSECAYVAGAYAGDDFDSQIIQRLISAESNGQKCKRIFRGRVEYTVHLRKDFHTYNIQWMLYLLWQKCLQNEDFANLLKRIPIDAYVVENTSLHHGETSTFWGAKNKELMVVRKYAESEVAKNGTFRFKKDLKHAQMMASNAINDTGHFAGINVMGKIIKICSLSLIFNQEPPMDYTLLHKMGLSMFGQRIDFPEMKLIHEVENRTSL